MNKSKEFIKSHTHYGSNKMIASSNEYHEWLTPEQALRAIEIEREELVDRAWEWVENNVLSINQQDKSRLYFEQFINYMED